MKCKPSYIQQYNIHSNDDDDDVDVQIIMCLFKCGNKKTLVNQAKTKPTLVFIYTSFSNINHINNSGIRIITVITIALFTYPRIESIQCHYTILMLMKIILYTFSCINGFIESAGWHVLACISFLNNKFLFVASSSRIQTLDWVMNTFDRLSSMAKFQKCQIFFLCHLAWYTSTLVLFHFCSLY